MHGAELAIEILRSLAELAENFPDDSRLGRRLLFIGGLLLCAIFVPDTSAKRGGLILVSKYLSAITGGVCVVFGAFVFFFGAGMETAGKASSHHHFVATEISVRG